MPTSSEKEKTRNIEGREKKKQIQAIVTAEAELERIRREAAAKKQDDSVRF